MLRKYALTVVFLFVVCGAAAQLPTTNTIPMARVMSSVRPSCLPTPRFSTGQSRPCPTSTAAFRPSICPTSRSAAAGSITPRRRPPFPGWGFRPAISVRCGCSGLGKSAVPGSRHCPRPSAVPAACVPSGSPGRWPNPPAMPPSVSPTATTWPGRNSPMRGLRDGAGMSLPPSRPARGATCTSKASSRMP